MNRFFRSADVVTFQRIALDVYTIDRANRARPVHIGSNTPLVGKVLECLAITNDVIVFFPIIIYSGQNAVMIVPVHFNKLFLFFITHLVVGYHYALAVTAVFSI